MSAMSPRDTAPVVRHNPSTMWDSTANGHSQISVAQARQLAYLSGQIASPLDGSAVPETVGGQAELIADSLKAALQELGASTDDIVMLRIYVVDGTTERFLEAYAPIQAMLAGTMPSLTVLGVQSLFTPMLQLEVEMVVRVP
ncbi:RidA family protein [Mesorhizobium sp. P5_C1]